MSKGQIVDIFKRPHLVRPIGDQLCRVRYQADISQAELANKMGISVSTISRYEDPKHESYDLKIVKRYVEFCCGRLVIYIDGPRDRERAKAPDEINYFKYLKEFENK